MRINRRILGAAGALAMAAMVAGGAARANAETLAEAMAAAYVGNPVLLSERAAQRASDEQVPQALSGWRPTVTVTGTFGKADVRSETSDDVTTPKSIALNITQPLYRGGRTVAQTRRAENLVLAVTHTHNAPSLRGYAVVVWGGRATDAQKANMNKYTDWLIERIVEVATAALKARRPASLSWGMGRAGFGGNRRILNQGRWAGFGFQKDGPVDHSLPFMVAKDINGKVIAIWANYACHCTTLGGRNRICGDWAGFAGEGIENNHPGSISVVTVGCGADVGPQPSRGIADAKSHGQAIARGVAEVMKKGLKKLGTIPTIRQRTIQLPLEKPLLKCCQVPALLFSHLQAHQ